MRMEGDKLPNLQLVVFIQCKKNHAANQSTMEANRVKIVVQKQCARSKRVGKVHHIRFRSIMRSKIAKNAAEITFWY